MWSQTQPVGLHAVPSAQRRIRVLTRQIVMMSFAFLAPLSSMVLMYWSVNFCSCVSARYLSSSPASPLIATRPCLRALRTDTFAASTSCLHSFAIASSVSADGLGTGMRISCPSTRGFSPRGDARMAFSTAAVVSGSYTDATRSWASRAPTVARAARGALSPYASTLIPSSIPGEALPLRMALSWFSRCSRHASISNFSSVKSKDAAPVPASASAACPPPPPLLLLLPFLPMLRRPPSDREGGTKAWLAPRRWAAA
mmetsp:Transcript_5589/g.15994  ORF Transcript_5589/g.15994 Transcript_5589/m.15994 type:complete len:256 (+) Transcript_5589:1185-1952(+)